MRPRSRRQKLEANARTRPNEKENSHARAGVRRASGGGSANHPLGAKQQKAAPVGAKPLAG